MKRWCAGLALTAVLVPTAFAQAPASSAAALDTRFDADWQVSMPCPGNTEGSAARG